MRYAYPSALPRQPRHIISCIAMCCVSAKQHARSIEFLQDQASTCGEAYPVQSLQARDNTTSHPLQPIPHTRQSCRSPYKDSDSQTVPDLIPSVPLLILRPNTFVSLPSI